MKRRGLGSWTETPNITVAGAGIVSDLPTDLALPAWETYRCVMLYAKERIRDPSATGVPFDREAVTEMMYQLLERSSGPPEGLVRFLVAILVELVADDPDVRRIALACIGATEWAIGPTSAKPYVLTGLAFLEASALVSGSPRYWFLAGKIHRHYGEYVKAEFFLARAMEMAHDQGDVESLIRLRLASGNIHLARGDFESAERDYLAASRSCVLYRLQGTIVAEVHHDLMIVRTARKEYSKALVDAEKAVTSYTGADHPRIPFLVHDLAWLWIEMGDYVNGLQMLSALLENEHSFVVDPLARMMVTANLLRAAAGARAVATYELKSREFDVLLDESLKSGLTVKHAPAALAAARGAAAAGDSEHFAKWITFARESAARLEQEDVLTEASELLKRQLPAEAPLRSSPRHGRLAIRALRVLTPN